MIDRVVVVGVRQRAAVPAIARALAVAIDSRNLPDWELVEEDLVDLLDSSLAALDTRWKDGLLVQHRSSTGNTTTTITNNQSSLNLRIIFNTKISVVLR